MSTNRVELEGILVSEPRRGRTPAGTGVVSFRLRVEAEPEVLGASGGTVPVVMLGRESSVDALAKGGRARILGRLAERRWTTKSGLAERRLEVLAESVTILTDP